MPYDKPVSNKALQALLNQIFLNYAEHSHNLAYLDGTQGNESFNETVASKAPASKDYGGHGSLRYRIATKVKNRNISIHCKNSGLKRWRKREYRLSNHF